MDIAKLQADVELRKQYIKEEELKFIAGVSLQLKLGAPRLKPRADDEYRIRGAIIKIKPEVGYNNYVTAFGNPFDESTLIVGDTENNLVVCFKGDLPARRQILDRVSVVPYFDYTRKCIIHKKQKPADVPQYLINVIFQNNITNNINITEDFTQRLQLGASNAENFMSRFYCRGGTMPLATARSNSEWMPEYKAALTIKTLNMCKTCGNKAHKRCCPSYSTENRSKTVMILGWSEARRAEVPNSSTKVSPSTKVFPSTEVLGKGGKGSKGT